MGIPDPDATTRNNVKEMTEKLLDDGQNYTAKQFYGKPFKDLSPTEKTEVNNIINSALNW